VNKDSLVLVDGQLQMLKRKKMCEAAPACEKYYE